MNQNDEGICEFSVQQTATTTSNIQLLPKVFVVALKCVVVGRNA